MNRFARWPACALLLLLLAACARKDTPGKLVVDSAWLRASVPGATVGAAYGVLRNEGGAPVSVVAVEAPFAESAMIHSMESDHGVMKMRHLSMLEVPAGQSVELAPGGTHLMLMGLKQPLVAGESATVSFILESGEKIDVQMPVRESAG